MESTRSPLEQFVHGTDGPRVIGQPINPIRRGVPLLVDLQGDPRAAPTLPTYIPRSSTPESYAASSSRSIVSSPTSTDGSFLSRTGTRSSISTFPDLGPPEDELDHHLSNREMDNNEPVYSCTFNFKSCNANFEPYDFDNWYRHSLSHFENRPLPKYTLCIFCNMTFENKDRNVSWQQRMGHIADHLDAGLIVEVDARPDFPLINHMYSQGLISSTLLESLRNGCERPPLKGFRPHDYIPESIKNEQQAQAERENRIVVKEPRRRRHEGYSRRR